jgi:hypothetical protein
MHAFAQMLQGIGYAHLSLLIFFLIGSVAFPWCDWEDGARSAERLMTRVACTCGLGLAIVGLGLFAIGTFGWLTVPGICVLLVLLFAGGCAAWRLSPLRASFWRARIRAVTHCWSWPLVLIWAGLVLVGTRAVIPDANGYSDSIYYHLAYAQDWANAGRITLDPYLQFPFFANNFLLLYAAWLVFGAGVIVQFVTWIMGLLAALTVYAAIADYADRLSVPAMRVAIALLCVVGLVAGAIFLDFSVLGYVDVPLGTMALLAVLAIQIALRERRTGWLVVAAVIAGFLIGMKASYILLVPVYAIAIGWAALVLGMRRWPIAALLALLCVVGAPWYVRNLWLAGDPIPPTMNLMLYHHDGLLTQYEWDGLWHDMQTPRNPKAFVLLPWRAFAHPTSPNFREYGASGMILFLYVPTIVAIVMLLLRKRPRDDLLIAVFVLTYFWLYWFAASSLLRYSLLFYPLLAVCVGALLLELANRWPRLIPVALVLGLVAATPYFGNRQNFSQFAHSDVLEDWHLLLHYPGAQAYLMKNDEGYPAAWAAMQWMREHGSQGKVYVISDNSFDFYFRLRGITSIGTWTGPSGYFRLLQALDAGEAAQFLDDLGVRAVLISPQQLLDQNIGHLLAEQLSAAGYRRLPIPGPADYGLYVREGSLATHAQSAAQIARRTSGR